MTKTARFTRSLAISLREVICSINFWLAAMLIFIVLTAEIAEDVFHGIDINSLANNGAAYNFDISLSVGYYIYAAPLACAFAASGNWIRDEEAGFYRLRLLKSSKHGYSYSLFLGTSIGGGLALMLGVLLFAVLCVLTYSTKTSIEDMAVMDAWYPVITGTHAHWKFMLWHVFFAFLFGTLWSGVGLVISVYSPIRYVAYLTPFILCFCAALALPYSLQPLEMLVQLNWESFTFSKLLLYDGALYIFSMLWFDLALERRVLRA